MSKRKREAEDRESTASESEIPDRSIKIGVSRLKAKTGQFMKRLHDALKLARGFERQKLGRRQKTATQQKNEKELERLKAEVLALKALDLNVTAKNHLFKQYTKTKRVYESAIFKAAYGEDVQVKGPKDAAEANVLGRLFNSNPVKQTMPDIMSSILNVLGLEDFADAKTSGRRELMKGSDIRKKKPSAGINGHSPNHYDADEGNMEVDEDEVFHGFSDDDRQSDHGVHEHSADDMDEDPDDVDLDLFNDRLASSSDSEADDAYIPELKVPPKSNGVVVNESYSKARDLSISPSPSLSLSPSPSPPPTAKAKPKKKDTASRPPPSSTTFLPSLTMGGYFSGSESDADDDPSGYNPDDDPMLAKPRKNRRGQRARQLINERKYGKNAKHLVKARETEAGWDARRGAVYGKDQRGQDRRYLKRKADGRVGGEPANGTFHDRPRKSGMPRGRGPQSSGANEEGLGRSRNFGSKPAAAEANAVLHPSWEAAKKRKDERVAGKFEGKKITFD